MKAVIFDVDGTLVNSVDLHINAGVNGDYFLARE